MTESKTNKYFLWKVCGSLPVVENGAAVLRDNTSLGFVADMVCNAGYEASKSTITCKISGYWEQATCTGVGNANFNRYLISNFELSRIYIPKYQKIIPEDSKKCYYFYGKHLTQFNIKFSHSSSYLKVKKSLIGFHRDKIVFHLFQTASKSYYHWLNKFTQKCAR